MKMGMQNNPQFQRTFSPQTESAEFVWHRDRKDRVIDVLESDGWFFQFEDKIPFELKEGDRFYIRKEEYHRVVKPYDVSGSLTIDIKEYDDE